MNENLENLRRQMGKKKPGKVYERQPAPHFCDLCTNAVAGVTFGIDTIEVGHERSCKNYQKKVQ